MSATSLTDLTRYADATKHYSRESLWALFDGDRDHLNVTHECVDRHAGASVAVRISKPDGSCDVITFQQLSAWSARIANWLTEAGVARGQRVAIMLEPSLAFYATLFGAMKCGAVAVPLFTLFGPDGLALRSKDCEPVILVIFEDKFAMGAACGVPKVLTGTQLLDQCAGCSDTFDAATAPHDMALFQYTSGTTRELPEAVKHRHRTVVTVAVAALYATGVRPGDRFMCPSSPAWGHGLAHGTLGPLGLGVSTASYAGPFDAERLLGALDELEITNLSAAATHYRMMRQSGAAPRHKFALEKLTFTGEPLDSQTAAWALETFGQPVRSIYGTTEVGVILSQYPGADDLEVRSGSLGKAMPGLEVAVLDEQANRCAANVVGEIAVARRGGWVMTKDRGHTDAAGYFYHDGRTDDVIISAGWTISAKEVENSLLTHPAVLDAAVVAEADELRGQIVLAYVVSRGNVGDTELQQYVKQRLSAHEYPRRVAFVDEIPKTPAGKTDRRALRQGLG